MKSYTCLIHRPSKTVPNLVTVSCEGAERAMLHAERAAKDWADWRRIEVYLGQSRVAVREREAA